MSIYEMLRYDDLMLRSGIPIEGVWHCGDNPAPDVPYNGPGTYNDPGAYSGNGQQSGAGFCLTGDINVNGLLLNNRDKNGTVWLCNNVEGWWTLPPSEIPDVPQPFWDGSLLTTGRYLARTITITGTFIPPNKSWVWYNRDAIMRASGVVRGAGLITLCGNESATNKRLSTGTDDAGNTYQYLNPLYTPPKMAVIQMADTPLVDTVKSSGLTQFSMSFKCVQPTKLSIYEQIVTLDVPKSNVSAQRHYEAFSTPFPADVNTTEYPELLDIENSAVNRTYQEVLNVSWGAPIPGEEFTQSTPTPPHISVWESYDLVNTTDTEIGTTVFNGGDYFAFPIFVFGKIDGTDPKKARPNGRITLRNMTTGEYLEIVKNVPAGKQLVIDCGLRRVAIVSPSQTPKEWVWDNRSNLSMTSQWISLAPGNNLFICDNKTAGDLDNMPKVYYRETWVG